MRRSNWRLAGKTVLLTGAASGIGAATARLLAAQQAKLALLDVRGDALRGLAGELGDTACWHAVDITRGDELEDAVAAIVARLGGIDVVVANAGVVTVGSVERGDPAAFEHVIAVNLLGTWRTLRAALPCVLAAEGYVLVVSSLSGTIQGPLHAAYDASKAGIQAIANTLRLEVAGRGVAVGTAHLVYTATETGRAAVEHPLMRGLPGLPQMKPEPVERTAALLVRGIERRARTVAAPSTRLALFTPGLVQLTVEGMARRRQWADAIRENEGTESS